MMRLVGRCSDDLSYHPTPNDSLEENQISANDNTISMESASYHQTSTPSSNLVITGTHNETETFL